jgi:hypothetical protein
MSQKGNEGGSVEEARETLESAAVAARESLKSAASEAKESLEAAVGTARAKLGSAAGTAQETLGVAAGTAQETLGVAAGTAQETLGVAAGTAREAIDTAAGTARGEVQLAALDAAGKALILASQLASVVTDIQARLKTLAKYGRHNRQVIIGLVVSICLDVGLSVLAIFLVNSLHNSQNTTHTDQLNNCVAGNATRVQDIILWNSLFNDLAPPGTKVTPANAVEIKELNHLRVLASAKDAPVNCTQRFGASSITSGGILP